MKKFIKFGVILLITFLASCQKDDLIEPETNNVKNMNELKVPQSFNWKTEKDVSFNLKIAYDAYQGATHKISIYNGNPFTDGQLILSGSVSVSQGYTGTLRIPSYLKKIYVLNETPKGMKELVALDVNGNTLSYTFETKAKLAKSVASGPTSPDCNTGCDVTVSNNGYFSINGNKTYCISSTNFNGSVQFEHWNNAGKLRICGNATFTSIDMGNNSTLEVASGATLNAQNIQMNGNAKLIFYDNAHVSISTLNMNQADTKLDNYSLHIAIGNGINVGGIVNNYGTIAVNGFAHFNGNNGSLYNYGTFTSSDNLEINNKLENSGSIIVTGNIHLNSQANVLNYCKMSCTNDFEQNNSTLIVDNGYIYAGEKAQFNGNTTTIIKNGSMISSKDVILNAGILGQGSTNTLKSSHEARINGSANVNGPIEWADNNGVLDNGNTSSFINGATFKSFANATNVIPTSSCNPEGIGSTQTIGDTDGDGVSNNLDEYPNDPARAYNNYFPSQNTWGTLAYEDLWPKKGDYDFNDMVIRYNVKTVTNAQNKVVEIQPRLVVKAVGATIQSGFAFQFDNLLTSDIASVTGNLSSIAANGNGTESGTNKAVVIAFDKADQVIHRVGGSTYFNTLKGNPSGTSDTVKMRIIFSNALTPSVLGSSPFNPFIFRTNERGHEVHLPNYIPTSKADLSLFDTMDDGSVVAQGKYYKTSDNLPWAININETFEYPIEFKDITQAYLKFATWAQSGGSSFPDWYKNLSGYRNQGLIY